MDTSPKPKEIAKINKFNIFFGIKNKFIPINFNIIEIMIIHFSFNLFAKLGVNNLEIIVIIGIVI